MGNTPRVTVADALFTETKQRVLSVLFGNTGRTYYASEIIALAQIGSGAVQRELARLEASGLVTAERIGNQKHYRANDRSPVFEPLRELVLRTTGLADVIRQALVPVELQIEAAFVFGSVAKREDHASSDVDLFVISDSLAFGELFGALQPAAQKLGREINPVLHSMREVALLRRKKHSFIERVIEQPKIWIYGTEDVLATR
jgi:predicted nucleotidyltransferase